MKQFALKSGLFDRKRELILTPEYLEYETGNLKGHEFTRLYKSDIKDFKHSMDWIVLYEFTTGRKFAITLKDKSGKELNIRFKSFPASNKKIHHLYAQIIAGIWEYYYQDVVNEILEGYYKSGELIFSDVLIDRQGVMFQSGKSMIPWDKVSINSYVDYFAIYHRDNSLLNLRLEYYAYGMEAIYCIVKTILEQKNRA